MASSFGLRQNPAGLVCAVLGGRERLRALRNTVAADAIRRRRRGESHDGSERSTIFGPADDGRVRGD
ncbi:unnamed protein product [Heligmosomoides polygyrus]|uniref:DUF1534 domain-containing protein n=1 Tax=Heligmosomoides polygyrus TaxID=6339 RepID=A0A183FHM8_HELPZ|nr:unnamed protein product [Heligmosomoides polygyrus]